MQFIINVISGLCVILILRAGWIAILLWKDYKEEKGSSPSASILFTSIMLGGMWVITLVSVVDLPIWLQIALLFILILRVGSLELFFHEMQQNGDQK